MSRRDGGRRKTIIGGALARVKVRAVLQSTRRVAGLSSVMNIRSGGARVLAGVRSRDGLSE